MEISIRKEQYATFKLEYDAGNFFEGLAWIEKEGKYGFIDNKGNVVVEPIYDSVSNFQEGLAKVEKNKKYGQ